MIPDYQIKNNTVSIHSRSIQKLMIEEAHQKPNSELESDEMPTNKNICSSHLFLKNHIQMPGCAFNWL